MVRRLQVNRRQSSRHGTDQAFWSTLLQWRSLVRCRFNGLVSSQHEHHTVATGFWRCRSLPVCEDEAVRIAVALRLGSQLRSPHTCRCDSLVQANGVHGLVCKEAHSRVVRHHALNECISRAFSAAGILVRKEPAGLVQRQEAP